jgi:hypothetical protein
MKTKLLILLLIIIITSPFLIYKFNKDLSKKYLTYYFNSKFSKLSDDIKISFSDFSLKSNDKFNELIVNNISVISKNSKIAEIDELRFHFNWGFLYTKVKPIKAIINYAVINIPNVESKEESYENKIEDLFAATELLNTEIILENIQFNDYLIKNGFIRLNKKNKKDILNIKINETHNSEIEIEVAQPKFDKVTVNFKSFNPRKSVFYELIKNYIKFNTTNIDTTLDGYFIIDINKQNMQGVIDNISGNINIKENFSLNFEKGSFTVEATKDSFAIYNSNINIDDFFFSGEIHYRDGLYVNGRVENISYSEILKYWNLQKETKARNWYQDNIKSGIVKSAEIIIDEANDSVVIKDLYFEDLNSYISEDNITLDISDAYGYLELVDKKLNIDLKSANLYKTKVSNLNMEVEEENKNVKISINGNVTDNIQNLLLISQNLIEDQIKVINKAINLNNLTDGLGIISFKVDIYPENKSVSKQIYANFQNLSLSNLYDSFDLQDSDLHLKIDDKTIKLDGIVITNGKVINLDIQNDYSDLTYVKIDGDFNIKNFKQAKFIPDLKFITGNFLGNFKIIINKNEDLIIEGYGNLNDITDDITKVLGWKNDKKSKFTFNINKKGSTFDIKNLQISGDGLDIHANGKITQKDSEVIFDKINIQDSRMTLHYKSNKETQNVYIKSNFLDLSKFSQINSLFSNKKEKSKYSIDAQLFKIKLKDNISLLDTKIQWDNTQGKLNGIFNDNSILSISYDESIGIDLDTTNAGTLLRSLGINNSVVDGRASVHLDTKDTRYNSGTVRMENFSIKNAPTLARILSLASLRGIIDVLNGGGIYFYRFLSSFQYGDGVIEFNESWLEGNALGISAGGIISIPENSAIIHGNVVPLYKLNKIIWKLPLIGKIVTGGGKSRSVIATEYTMNKTSEKTSVYVNPLTAFTPNILKKFLEIFN